MTKPVTAVLVVLALAVTASAGTIDFEGTVHSLNWDAYHMVVWPSAQTLSDGSENFTLSSTASWSAFVDGGGVPAPYSYLASNGTDYASIARDGAVTLVDASGDDFSLNGIDLATCVASTSNLFNGLQPRFILVSRVTQRWARAQARGEQGFCAWVHDIGSGVKVDALLFVNAFVQGGQLVYLAAQRGTVREIGIA